MSGNSGESKKNFHDFYNHICLKNIYSHEVDKELKVFWSFNYTFLLKLLIVNSSCVRNNTGIFSHVRTLICFWFFPFYHQ